MTRTDKRSLLNKCYAITMKYWESVSGKTLLKYGIFMTLIVITGQDRIYTEVNVVTFSVGAFMKHFVGVNK